MVTEHGHGYKSCTKEETVPRRLALVALTAATFMIILSETIVNVALRAIQDDLGFSSSGLAWVVNAYLVPFGGLLLLAGRVGDLVGRRSVFLAGIALFTAASLLSGLATGPAWLVTARFAQGVGAALTASVALAMLVTIYPEPVWRARAIAIYSFVGAGGASIGVTLGGLITGAVGWHWIFMVNVPIGVAAFALSLRVLPAGSPARHGGDRPDVAGGLLVTGGLMLLVYAIVAPRLWTFVAAAALLAAFVARQATVAAPLVPRRLVRSRQVVVANLVTVVTVAAMIGFQFLVGLYLQRVLGQSPAVAGLAMLPVTIGIAVVSLGVAGRLAARLGERPVLVGGLVAVLAGYALLTQIPVAGSYAVRVLPALLLLGTGVGLVLPTITGLAMSGATPADSGAASGLLNTTQQVGGALGLAVLVAVADGRTAGRPGSAALVDGYRLAFVVGLAFVAAGVLLALTLRRASAPATAAAAAPPVAAAARNR